MPRRNKWLTRKRILQICDIFLVLAGCCILAFGDAAFIVPTNLLTGGIASIAIIVQHIVGPSFAVADIVTAGLEILLFFVGLFVLGKRFSAHTLLASLAYPGFFALFYRTDWVKPIYEALTTNFADGMYVGYLLCGIFGGVLVGLGVAVTFLGGGSTGGLDIIAVIVAKFTPIKESIATFIVDATIVMTGIIIMRDVPNIIPLGLIGVLSAAVCAFMIQVLYVSSNSFFVYEIISVEYKKIVEYIEDDLERGCTVFYGEGGYQAEKKMVVKVALKKEQGKRLRFFISSVDPKAFLIVYPSATINGEGFVAFSTPRAYMLRQFYSSKKDVRTWDTSSEEK